MSANLLKLIAAALLFAAWGAIVFAGKTSMPGADTFVAWIQYALLGLGVVHLTAPGNVGGNSAPQSNPKEPSP